MVQIQRVIDGKVVMIALTEEEIQDVRKADKIQYAKDILANYADMIAGYDTLVKDEEKLLSYADRLEEKLLENNGEKEIEVIQELFPLNEEY